MNTNNLGKIIDGHSFHGKKANVYYVFRKDKDWIFFCCKDGTVKTYYDSFGLKEFEIKAH